MATIVTNDLLGKRIRVTRLDASGNVPLTTVADSFIVTSGFVSVGMSFEMEDGDEIIVKRADGSLCINEKFSDSFKRATVEIELCEVNPNALTLMTNAEPYTGTVGTDVIGFTVPEGTIDKFFALELWMGLAGQGCTPGAAESSDYLLLPFVGAGLLGGITINGTDAITFTMTGASTKGGNAWGVGPWLVYDGGTGTFTPAKLPTALDPDDHLLMIATDVPPPAASAELIPMPT